MLISDLELVETIDGYCDVVYGTYEPKYLNWYFPLITVWIIPLYDSDAILTTMA